MAKRRAENTLLHDSPSKRCCRSLYSIDMQLGSMAPSGGLNPPSLLALLGSRGRKRPHYFEDPENQDDEEAALYLKTTHCDVRKHAAHVLTVQTSGSFQERHTSSTLTSSKKRAREDYRGPEISCSNNNVKVDEDTKAEDCTYNSFQYWRIPLPELDLSLLEEDNDNLLTQEKSKVKDSFSDAMET
ncbi:uncharacterized protein wu:fa19b12 [Cheilinus undulatus]|uniref:uncharacterized protein wu:fa19b12 n=1 Tax=Cheilinus undulatus TaxID=241271 RepID=UPI001BD62656|nr:uncharacterized protein wu:fa19b12 [Cheilinus undulatus]